MEKKTKHNQLKWGVVLSYTAQAITLLSGLLYTPFMLKLLGQSEYGLYQLSSSMIAYLGLLNFGFSSGYLRIYFRYKQEDDTNGIAGLNGLYLIIFLIISLITVITGLIVIGFSDDFLKNGLTETELIKIKPLMLIMLFTLILTFLSSVFDCYISAYSEFIFQRGLQVLKALLNPFIMLPLLLLGYKSLTMATVSALLTLANFCCSVLFCVKKLNMQFRFSVYNASLIKEISNFTLFIFISSVVDKINFSLDNFLLGSISGTVMVSVYSLGSQINGYFNIISTSVATLFAPRINQIVAKSNDNELLTDVFIKISRLLFVILTMVWLGFLFFGKTFVLLWVGNDYEKSYYIAFILMSGCIVQLIQICGIEIQKAKNMHKNRSIAYFIAAIFNIIISIPLIKLFGAIGASLGTMISMTICSSFYMNWFYNNKIGLNMARYWKSLLSIFPCFIVSISVGIIYLKMGSNNIFLFIAFASVFCITFVLSIYIKAKCENKSIKKIFLE